MLAGAEVGGKLDTVGARWGRASGSSSGSVGGAECPCRSRRSRRCRRRRAVTRGRPAGAGRGPTLAAGSRARGAPLSSCEWPRLSRSWLRIAQKDCPLVLATRS